MPIGDVTAATRLSSLPIQYTQANKMPISTIFVTYPSKHTLKRVYSILQYTTLPIIFISF
jgi:hypothetical protein